MAKQKKKPTILSSRRQVVSALINQIPGGRETAACVLGMDLKKFDNHAYENNNHRPLSDEHIYALEQVTGTTLLADYICHQYDGLYVPLPDTTTENLDLFSRGLDTNVQRGRVDTLIAEALKDGVLTEQEVLQILQAHRQHMAARHAEVEAVIFLHRPQP